jgi:hypothetical protein
MLRAEWTQALNLDTIFSSDDSAVWRSIIGNVELPLGLHPADVLAVRLRVVAPPDDHAVATSNFRGTLDRAVGLLVEALCRCPQNVLEGLETMYVDIVVIHRPSSVRTAAAAVDAVADQLAGLMAAVPETADADVAVHHIAGRFTGLAF